ncbi:unnamed protein product [Spirodela intermedia]|uniref:Uncharacterized protein n=1 Tax=Spirodela intermedia TaxID=51605 RepID=A0A7I8IPZ7_SPIIN|nr:unnamed protein product [Spirodela intermedia]CAA6660038.1 unnamed protein product [Spirodela intermedia]
MGELTLGSWLFGLGSELDRRRRRASGTGSAAPPPEGRSPAAG